jgi:hypothetical protein
MALLAEVRDPSTDGARTVNKTIYLLNIGGSYAPELTALTYPHIEAYARKIGADIHVIDERRFPDWDTDYEKLQIYDLASEREDDWSIYIDSDALVHPELPDVTTLIPRDTVAHNGADFAGIRWRYDRYFLRDGRNIGSCNWFAMASSWCRDLWRPLDDLTFEEAVDRIAVTVEERHTNVSREHLVSDYALSRNIARFGLKFQTLNDLWPALGLGESNFFHHEYTVGLDEKIKHIRQRIEAWRI